MSEREDRFTWRKDDVEFERDPTRPPLLTPEQAGLARENLRRYREEQKAASDASLVEMVADPETDPNQGETCKHWAQQVLTRLGEEFGLVPEDLNLRLVEILPPHKVDGCAGDYDNGVVGIADDLVGGVSPLKAGQRKAAADGDRLCFEGVFRHECGHAWQRAFEEETGLKVADLFRKAKPATARDVTEYSASNPVEWFAESFACYTHPRFAESGVKLYTPLLAEFESLLKPGR